MNSSISEAGAHAFYLPHQIIVSLLWAFIFMMAGLILAWSFWGHCKGRVAKINAKNQALEAELEKLQA